MLPRSRFSLRVAYGRKGWKAVAQLNRLFALDGLDAVSPCQIKMD